MMNGMNYPMNGMDMMGMQGMPAGSLRNQMNGRLEQLEQELCHLRGLRHMPAMHEATMQPQLQAMPFAPIANPYQSAGPAPAAGNDKNHAVLMQAHSELLEALKAQQAVHSELAKSHTELMKAHHSVLNKMATNSGPSTAGPAIITSGQGGMSQTIKQVISNDAPLTQLSEPTLVDNTLLFLPPGAVIELGIEPNMDDKGDLQKELWFGRVWELRGLLNAKYDALGQKVKAKMEKLPARVVRELDRKMADPKVRALLVRMAARWKGAALRSHMSLNVLARLRFCNMRGSVVYAHGSGGCSWDNFRICRMIAKLGMLVIAPDGFAYPPSTAMGQLRHKDVCPLKKGDDNVDYWEGDLMYASSASGAANYSTKADKVLEKPQEFMALYEKCYQLRRSELHFIIKRLPQWILTQGFFLGGTSEGAMTVARFDDQRYGEQIIGRFINSFGIEYCYFTPTPNDGKIGGQLDVPTLNIIGTKDQYFGAIDSVAKIVANDPTNGYGEKDLTGNGYKTMVAQKLNVGLVCVLEEGVHSPCNTHDNFLRQLFQHFFTRAASIWELDQIWSGDPTLKGLVEVKQSTTNEDAFTGCNIKQLFVPTMPFPNRMSLREVQALRCITRGGDVLATAMRQEGEIIKKEKAAIAAKLDAVRAGSSKNGGKGFQQTTAQSNFYHGDAQREVKNHK
ncbi:unnamed protein product [Polarella glacialis]|uniref:Uncharacterized protein n=2 Tax=Polarella glacialis TaxID=89957 RepID=A0A813EJQ3_POLGL|nr:unnamed protein product [Polarella glacialis]